MRVFVPNEDDLPLAGRSFGSSRQWQGECMTGAMWKMLNDDLSAWPRRLQGAVRDAVAAGRAALAAERPRKVQAIAYSAAFAALFAEDVSGLAPIVAAIMSGMSQLGGRASMLAIRGATNAVITGARMQVPGARCAFCHAVPDAWSHFADCGIALSAFCRALGRPAAPHLALDLMQSPEPPARLCAALAGFASVACATTDEVVARAPDFMSAAAAALVRSHVIAPAAAGEAQWRRRRARSRPCGAANV